MRIAADNSPTSEPEAREVRGPGAAPAPSGGAFSRALTQGLNLPITALRASVESLSQELSQVGVGALRIVGVLREVERLAENVRELVDFATPPVLRPLRCTLEEILSGARAALPAARRGRVLLARMGRGAALHLDGPLLSTCLRRLTENALEAGSEHVLLVGRAGPGCAVFSVIDDAPGGFDPDSALADFHTTKPNHLGLGIALTRRDVALMNGRLEFLSTPGGETCARITVPAAAVEETR